MLCSLARRACLLACSRPLAVSLVLSIVRAHAPMQSTWSTQQFATPRRLSLHVSISPSTSRIITASLAVLSEGRGRYQSHDVVLCMFPKRQKVNIKPRINSSVCTKNQKTIIIIIIIVNKEFKIAQIQKFSFMPTFPAASFIPNFVYISSRLVFPFPFLALPNARSIPQW